MKTGRITFVASLLLMLPACASASTHAKEKIIGIPSVIDGDTLEIHGKRIRLYGIDAPESRQLCYTNGKAYKCGQKAALALDALIANTSVNCTPKDKDRYDRIVAVCHVDDTDINGWLVEHGWALAYRRYSKDYVTQETVAQSEARGIWAGEFEKPWLYRAQARSGHKAKN